MNTKQTFITPGMIKSRQKMATKASKYYIYVIHPKLIHIFITINTTCLCKRNRLHICARATVTFLSTLCTTFV